jgi:hypothetical protein
MCFPLHGGTQKNLRFFFSFWFAFRAPDWTELKVGAEQQKGIGQRQLIVETWPAAVAARGGTRSSTWLKEASAPLLALLLPKN